MGFAVITMIDPNGGVNLPWSGYPGLHLNHGENPKVFGSSFKTL